MLIVIVINGSWAFRTVYLAYGTGNSVACSVCELDFIPFVLLQVEKLMRKKQLDVADFSVYWDTSCTLLGDLPPGKLQVLGRILLLVCFLYCRPNCL